MFKFCARCGITKSVSDFSKNRARKDGLQVSCKECYKVLNNSAYKTASGDRRKKIREASNAVRDENKKIISEHKDRNPCLFCGEKEHACLDFHHLNPEIKDKPVSAMLLHSKKRLVEEIEKCVVLCANCHRKHHAGVDGFEL